MVCTRSNACFSKYCNPLSLIFTMKESHIQVINSKTLVVLCFKNIVFRRVRFTMWEESQIQVINSKTLLLLFYSHCKILWFRRVRFSMWEQSQQIQVTPKHCSYYIIFSPVLCVLLFPPLLLVLRTLCVLFVSILVVRCFLLDLPFLFYTC